jgi:hypothetical protein
MKAWYSVIIYKPSLTAQEFINIGVITFNQDKVFCFFGPDFTRTKVFSRKEDLISLYKEIGYWYDACNHNLLFPGDKETEYNKYERMLIRSSDKSRNIQVTKPIFYPTEPLQLLEFCKNVYLSKNKDKNLFYSY